MPTGYTDAIGKGISFRKFVLTCARAMGACIMQRDESLDVEPTIPEASTYNAKALEDARTELNAIGNWSTADIAREYTKELAARTDSYLKYEAEKKELRNKYNAMLARVLAWEPPTADHEGLKDFMLQQIRESIRFDCHESEPPTTMSPEDWYQNKIDTLQKSMEYHEKANAEEIERTKSRAAWITALMESVPQD